MELVTGFKGKNHVTANQLADLQAGIIGKENCCLPIGEMLAAEIVSANKIRIKDGTILMQGRQVSIGYGNYDDVTIENGTTGLTRHDLIVATYTRDTSNGKEETSLEVIKGTSTADDPIDPEYTAANIREGASMSQCPLYRVVVEGLNIKAVERLFPIVPSLAGINAITLVQFPVNGWSASKPYKQTVQVKNMTDTVQADTSIYFPETLATSKREDYIEAYSCITMVESGNGTVTATCDSDKPKMAVTIQMKGVGAVVDNPTGSTEKGSTEVLYCDPTTGIISIGGKISG